MHTRNPFRKYATTNQTHILRLFASSLFLFLVITTNVSGYSANINGEYVPLDAAPLQKDCWGIYNWGADKKITRQSAPNVKGFPVVMDWVDLEPQKDNFQFKALLGKKLKKALENDFYIFALIWVSSPGKGSPKWLYDQENVPRVICHRTLSPLGEEEDPKVFPYYLDENYIKRYDKLIEEFGKYVNGLPDKYFNRIIFVQVCEGSTGDGQPYKGSPIKGYEQYDITKKQWSEFRIAAWNTYKKYFMDQPKRTLNIVVNADANDGNEKNWLMKNLNYIGIKQGMFTHGWHISGGATRRREWAEQVKQAELAGKKTFVRGEEDKEMFIYGRMTRNIPRGLYTSALYGLYNGVDCWNIPYRACLPQENQPAFIFFNKYAGKRNPRTAPAAFCALREGLNAANTNKFPETKFGKASKKNIKRYLAIAKAYRKNGAIQGAPEKAIKGGMTNRKRMDYNDVGWDINEGNYWRFLEQIEPEKTSQGWWHQGPENAIYSQFGRSFNLQDNQNSIFFKLDPWFYNKTKKPVSLSIRVVYLDKGKGSWSFIYSKRGKPTKAYTVQNNNSNTWKEKIIRLHDAGVSQELKNGADFALRYISGENTIFHIVEIDR